MAIAHYIKEIGRGKDGARALTRAQAHDLFGQVLDGTVSDLEVGAFCLAMRIKGETAQEMAGFLDATYERLQPVPAADRPLVVIPSYNGARKLPLLTPLLALLLAREGLRVLIHGAASESTRVFTADVLAALDIAPATAIGPVDAGTVVFAPTAVLCAGLQRLLEVRRVVGLRNPAHSLVKLMNPGLGTNLLISSYTHPEYALSMASTFELMQSNALLLRGTEGEAVADPRRQPKMELFLRGVRQDTVPPQAGSLDALPELPRDIDAASTAAYIRAVLAGERPVPQPIAAQVAHVVQAETCLQGSPA
ncbi:MAG: DNA-binding protein YbiB [Rhodoferax sp.]|nr:DNA-binding protein YbiB [Rhodoferax sp.]